jgi:hypothetical protein
LKPFRHNCPGQDTEKKTKKKEKGKGQKTWEERDNWKDKER